MITEAMVIVRSDQQNLLCCGTLFASGQAGARKHKLQYQLLQHTATMEDQKRNEKL